jgi:Thrombospondin type 3 repeat
MTAPNTPQNGSFDFDGDQVVDGGDACPEIAGSAAANGCPPRPDKLPDADGDHIPDSADACPSTPRGNDPNEDGCPDGSEPPPPPPPPPAENPPPAAPPSAPPPAPRAQPARVGATVSFRSSNRGRNTVFSSLQVRNIPGGATVVVRCRGKSCPVRRFVKRRAVGTLSLRQFVGKRLRPGTVLDIRVTKSGFVGLVKDITIRAGRTPNVRTLCLPPGSSRASRC